MRSRACGAAVSLSTVPGRNEASSRWPERPRASTRTRRAPRRRLGRISGSTRAQAILPSARHGLSWLMQLAAARQTLARPFK